MLTRTVKCVIKIQKAVEKGRKVRRRSSGPLQFVEQPITFKEHVRWCELLFMSLFLAAVDTLTAIPRMLCHSQREKKKAEKRLSVKFHNGRESLPHLRYSFSRHVIAIPPPPLFSYPSLFAFTSNLSRYERVAHALRL